MRNECNIIRDILPLYAEDMVSADTSAFVEEHLDTCADCRAELEDMKTPNAFEEPTTPTPPDRDTAPLKEFQQRWKKQKKLMIRNTVIATATVMVVALAIALGTIFLVRGARKTVSLYDYALSLGSDELFATGDCRLYRKVSETGDGRIYVQYDSDIEDFDFPRTFGKEPMSQLSPYEFATTYGGYMLFARGDGSLWVEDYTHDSQPYLRCIKPYFPEPEPQAPAAERSIELLELNFDHEYKLICDDSNTMHAVSAPAYSLIFRFTSDKLVEPAAAFWVQLEDGSWYRLKTNWNIDTAPDPKRLGEYYGSAILPYKAATSHIPEGQYCLTVYETADGEEVLLASQEFTLTWEGSYCRITGTEA